MQIKDSLKSKECCHTVNTNISKKRCILIKVTTPKARKDHLCSECNRVIKKGEEYRHEILKDIKRFEHKYCEDCLSVREVFFSSGWYYGLLWKQIEEFVRNCEKGISESQLNSITESARLKILNMIENL